MKGARFLAEFGQPDFFPDRSTVGFEITAQLLPAPKAFGALTEVGRRPWSTARRAAQRILPLSRLYDTPDARRTLR